MVDFILDSSMLIIGFIAFLIIGSIFFLLSKIPLFRWAAKLVGKVIKYIYMTVMNLLAVLLISGAAAFAASLLLALFYYKEWPFFTVGNDILIIGHDNFFTAVFLMGLSFVVCILFCTLIFSLLKLTTKKYIILTYLAAVLLFLVLLPAVLQYYTPDVNASISGMLLICGALPALALIYGISTAFQRKEERRRMSIREREREDYEEQRRRRFNRAVIFPWIRARAK